MRTIYCMAGNYQGMLIVIIMVNLVVTKISTHENLTTATVHAHINAREIIWGVESGTQDSSSYQKPMR